MTQSLMNCSTEMCPLGCPHPIAGHGLDGCQYPTAENDRALEFCRCNQQGSCENGTREEMFANLALKISFVDFIHEEAKTSTYEIKKNAYEKRLERRRTRLSVAASRARIDGAAMLTAARKMAHDRLFWQPILTGYYSEWKDRELRVHIEAMTQKGHDVLQQADKLGKRAAAIGTGAISSDDPDAVEKLRARLINAEKVHELMKETNKILRKGNRSDLAELGFTEDQIKRLCTPDRAGWIGFPDYALSKNISNMRRIKQRIVILEKDARTLAMEPK